MLLHSGLEIVNFLHVCSIRQSRLFWCVVRYDSYHARLLRQLDAALRARQLEPRALARLLLEVPLEVVRAPLALHERNLRLV